VASYLTASIQFSFKEEGLLQRFSGTVLEFIDQLKKYWQDRKINTRGKFEGLNLADEDIANDLLKSFNAKNNSGWRLETGVLIVDNQQLNVEENIKHTCKKINEKDLWWNPNGLATVGYIQSRKLTHVSKTQEITQDELAQTNEPFIWVESSPGMGKTILSIQIEEEWRKKYPFNRIVIRLEVSQIHNQQILKEIEAIKENAFVVRPFLQKFAPFLLPTLNALSRPNHASINVFILLDGLDEIKAEKYNVMTDILRSLFLSKKEAEKDNFRSHLLRQTELQEPLNLKRVFITARPQIQFSLKLKFNNAPYCLVPFQESDQIEYLTKEVKEVLRSPEMAKTELRLLQPTLQTLIETPLTLYMLAYFIRWKGKRSSSRVLNIFNLYERFVEAHYSRYISKTCTPGTTPSVRKEHEEELYLSHFPYYYNITLEIMRPNQQAHWPSVGSKPESSILDELKKIGLVQEHNNKIAFVHLSFAEFFYARIVCYKDTRVLLGNSVFRHIYSTTDLDQVEDFICAFIKKPNEVSSTDISLNISPECLRYNFCTTRPSPEMYCPVLAFFINLLIAIGLLGALVRTGLGNVSPEIRSWIFMLMLLACAQIMVFSLLWSILYLIYARSAVKIELSRYLKFCSYLVGLGIIAFFYYIAFSISASSDYYGDFDAKIPLICFCFPVVIITSLLGLRLDIDLLREIPFSRNVLRIRWWCFTGIILVTARIIGFGWSMLSVCLVYNSFVVGVFPSLIGLIFVKEYFDTTKLNVSRSEVLQRFIWSRLFPLVGFQVLTSSIKIDHKDCIKVIMDEARRAEGHLARTWLARKEFKWTKSQVLKLSCVNKRSLSDFEIDLAAKILCSDFEYLRIRLKPTEISLCLRRSKNIVRIINVYATAAPDKQSILEFCGLVNGETFV